MARSVASIAVSVVARTAKFRKGMQRAMRTLKKFGAGVRAMAARVAKFGSVLAGVAIGGMALFIKQSFKSLDALAKTSAKLGIAIDQLRGLERAAELTGGTIEQFRKSIIMMSKNISEAALGTGEALEAFELLGIRAEDLLQLAPDKAFVKIAKALDLIPGRIRKIGIAADIFGARSGTAILNLAALGPQLESTIARAAHIMGKFTDVELNLIERANDALGDTFRSLRGIADRLAVTVAPVVERIALALTDAFIGVRKQLPDILQQLRLFGIRALNMADVLFRQLKISILEMKAELLTTAQILLGAFKKPVPVSLIASRLTAESQARLQRQQLKTLLARRPDKLLGNRLALALENMIAGAEGAFKKSQADRAKRQVMNFLAPVINAIKDPLSVFRAIVADFNERLAPFKGKLRLKAPGAAPVTAQAGGFLTVNLSRQALRAFPGQKREQIVRDRTVEKAIKDQTRVIRQQGARGATYGL